MKAGRAALGALLMAGLGQSPVPAAGVVSLAIDPKASVLTFTIHRPGETIEGAAHAFAGEVVFDPDDPSMKGSVVLRVEASSLETGNRMRDRKMRNAHLEVDRFPEIVFRSTSIQVGPGRQGAASAPSGGGQGWPQRQALVEGVLTLHGIDRTLMVPAAIRYDHGVLTAEGSVSLTYSDYEIPIPRFLWLVMDDDIKVRFRFVTGAAAR